MEGWLGVMIFNVGDWCSIGNDVRQIKQNNLIGAVEEGGCGG